MPADTVFGCEMSILGTEYYVREEAIYHHRGRRSSEMEMIKNMEERRQSKEKVCYSSSSINRLNTEEVIHNDYSSLATSVLKISQKIFLSFHLYNWLTCHL